MFKKIILGLFTVLLLIVVIFSIYVSSSWDKKYDIPYPTLKSSTDSAIIAHGKYLVTGPAHCISCHVKDYNAMIRADTSLMEPLQGGVLFPMGPMGSLSPANLTPDPTTGIGRYDDGEVFRMMRHAVKPDGTATLSIMMPFWNMADDDLIAVVSYLRSLDPVENETPGPNYTFMGKIIRTMAPLFKPVTNSTPPAIAPAMQPTIERGKYLAHYVANCVTCHTNRDQMTFTAIGPEFAGGFEMEPMEPLHVKLGVDPDLWTRAPNITPHPNSALSKFKTLDEWIERFRTGRIIEFSPMDWGPFSRMTDADLEAIWLYLHSLDPVENEIGPVIFKKE
ncbi:MAG: cytochrome c [Saprospiraceae bacterium]|nr:cytochrome c [Saprospiraceae bacterium]